MKHNIYLLEIREEIEIPRYDVYHGHVVIADNKAEARKSCRCADECRKLGTNIWMSPIYTMCTKIGETNKPKRVVLSSFSAG